MAQGLLYLDSSAIVKLVMPEIESRALRHMLRAWPDRVSSVIAAVEVERAARRIGGSAVRRASSVLSRIDLIGLDDEVVRSAASLGPRELRALDAIHLATAILLGDDLGAFCAYDARLAAAAAKIGTVLAPA